MSREAATTTGRAMRAHLDGLAAARRDPDAPAPIDPDWLLDPSDGLPRIVACRHPAGIVVECYNQDAAEGTTLAVEGLRNAIQREIAGTASDWRGPAQGAPAPPAGPTP